MKNSKRAHRILAWLLTMTLIFTMSFSSIAYAADTDTAGETEGTNTEATTMDTSEEQTSDPAEDTAKASQEAEQEETQNPGALGEGEAQAPSIDENDVAAIGEQGYKTLKDAVTAAGNTKTTIKLLKDVENIATLTIEEGQNVTLDLNGKSISSAIRTDDKSKHYYAIDNYGTLTINDSSEAGNGTITARGIENLGNGHMTINGGKLIACDSNGGASIWNEADLTVNGGTFVTTHVGTASDRYGAGCLNNSGVTRIKGGVFTSVNKRTYAIISTGEIEITPAEGKTVKVTGAHGGLGVDSGTAVINGGTYASSEYYGLYVSNDAEGGDPKRATVTVNGGFFDGANYSVWIGSDYNDPVNSTIKINGGEFKKPLNAQACTGDGAIVVTGGTFSTDPSEFVAAGYEAKKTGDSWTVAETEAHKVAEVNGTHKYETLAAAVASAKEGATITLLDNIDIDSQITISKSVTIDLNGHNIAAKDARALHIAGGEVNITGEGTISANKSADSKVFKSASSVIRVGDNDGNARNVELTVGKKVTVSSNHCYGITVFGSKTTETVVVNGKVNVTGEAAAISGNGSTGYGKTSITVNGEVSAEYDNAIYQPQAGELIINGKVTGTGGIEAKAGNTEIRAGSEAVITATAKETSHKRNDNGCSTSGYAIAAVQNAAYAGNAAITIEGGTINGPVDIVNDNEAEKPASIVIRGGTFSVEPKADFIFKGYEAKKTGDSWTVDTIKVAKSGENEYASLEDAVKNVKDGGEITLLQDVSEKLKIDNSKTFTIDLNGKAYTGGHITLHSGFVTVKNGTLNVTSWVYASDQDNQYNSLTVEKDVVIDGPAYGIVSYQKAVGKDNYGSAINFHGTMKNVQNGIWVMGNIYTDLETAKNPIVINVDGTINAVSEGNAAVALNGSAIMNIEEGTSIEGATAVEVRAGKLTVNDGALTGTAVPTNVTPNGNGTATLGAGLAVAQHATALPIDVTVNGGTIEGYTGLLVTNPENRGNADKVKVTVEGGSFKAIKGGKNSIAKEDNAAEMTLLVNGGYFSDKPAENYLATGKTLVESDKSEFTYMVADKKTAAEADVDIKAAVGNVVVDEKTPDAVKEAIAGTTVSKKALDAAVKREINTDVTVSEDAVKDAKDKLKSDAVTVFAQAYLDIAVADNDYDGDKCVLDITPMYQLVATTENSADMIRIGENAVVIGEPQELKVNTAVEVTIPLPAGFTPKDDNTVTIKHTKSDGTVYYYSAKVTTVGGKEVATFTNPNGFSTFEVLKLSDNTKLDKVELTIEDKSIGTDIKANQLEYDIKFDAEKNVKDLTVNVAATANDRNAKIKVLVDGREVKDKKVSIGLGTRTFNVLVLSEDDTAVLYTFNAVRCELVDDVTLNKDTFTYNGKAQAPAVTVKTAAGTTLKNGDAYTVSYKGNRTSVGTHTVTVLCKGKYEGEISKNYTINPAKPAIKKIKSSKRKMKVYMTTKPGSNGAEYYKISYRQKGTSTWKSTTTSSSYKTIKGLKKGKRYYVKVCAYTGPYESVYSTTKRSKKIR